MTIIESFEVRFEAFSSSCGDSSSLQDFHRKHKLTLMAHGQEPARELGRIVAQGKEGAKETYRKKFNELIQTGPPPRSKHVNVLHHMLGHLKDQLADEPKEHLLSRINEYKEKRLELEDVVTDLGEYFEQYSDPWIREQTYWRDVGQTPPGEKHDYD